MKLFRHQEKMVKKVQDSNYAALFWEPGCGKTIGSLAAFKAWIKDNKNYKLLIIAPEIVLNQWPSEVRLILGNNVKITNLNEGCKTKKTVKRLENIEKEKDSNVCLFPISALIEQKLVQALIKKNFDSVIVDEAHVFKKPTSKRAKALLKIVDCENIKRKCILTGTPLTNSSTDQFMLFRILSKDLLAENMTDFLRRFCFWRPKLGSDGSAVYHKGRLVQEPYVGNHAQNFIKSQTQNFTTSEEFEKCVDAPQFYQKIVNFEMSPKLTKVYESLRDMLAYNVKSKDSGVEVSMVIENMLHKSLRLSQIAAGIIPSNEKGVDPMLVNDRAKCLDELLSIIKDTHKKMLIWSVFAPTYSQIKEVLDKHGLECGFITGKESKAKKDKALKNFKEKERFILVMHPGSGGVGLNLQEAGASIYYTKNYNLEQYKQSFHRNFRAGSIKFHKGIIHYHIEATDTIDAVIHKSIKKKEKMLSDFVKVNEELERDISNHFFK